MYLFKTIITKLTTMNIPFYFWFHNKLVVFLCSLLELPIQLALISLSKTFVALPKTTSTKAKLSPKLNGISTAVVKLLMKSRNYDIICLVITKGTFQDANLVDVITQVESNKIVLLHDLLSTTFPKVDEQPLVLRHAGIFDRIALTLIEGYYSIVWNKLESLCNKDKARSSPVRSHKVFY